MSFLYQALTSEEIAELRAKDAKADGLEQGIKQGLERGLEQGRKERDKELVLKLNAKGKSAEYISEILDLQVNDVESILND